MKVFAIGRPDGSIIEESVAHCGDVAWNRAMDNCAELRALPASCLHEKTSAACAAGFTENEITAEVQPVRGPGGRRAYEPFRANLNPEPGRFTGFERRSVTVAQTESGQTCFVVSMLPTRPDYAHALFGVRPVQDAFQRALDRLDGRRVIGGGPGLRTLEVTKAQAIALGRGPYMLDYDAENVVLRVWDSEESAPK